MTGTDGGEQVALSHPVARVMGWPVAEVDARASLVDVSEVLAAGEVGAVPVVAAGRLAGLISERDVVAHLALGSDPSHLTAGDVMTTEVVTVRHDDSILTAARLMCEAGVRHLPVLSDQTISGMVSMRDLLKVLVASEVETRRTSVSDSEGSPGTVVRPPWAG